MKALFFIEAPFQLLSAYEAISVYGVTKYKIFIRLSGKKNNDLQIIKLSETLFKNKLNIKYFCIKADKKSFLDLLVLIYIKINYIFINYKYDYIFIGNYDSKVLKIIINSIKKDRLILLDDGIKNILFQNNFNNNNNFNMFTMLTSIKPYLTQNIKYNFFLKFKNILKTVNIEMSDMVLFIGVDISESGIISEKQYLYFVEMLSRKYKNIIYIPHRAEFELKVNLINTFSNILVENINYPIELYPYYKQSIPTHILSFYSGALVSMNCLYPEIDITSYKFDYKNSSNTINLESVYNLLENYVKVVEIDKE